MSNNLKPFVFLIILNCGIFFSATAQNNKPIELDYYLQHCRFLLQDGGKWKVANKNYDPNDESSPKYYGYEYSKGLNENTMQMKSTGYFPKLSAWKTTWDGFYTWNSKKQKIIFQTVNTTGDIVTGESDKILKSGISFINTYTPLIGSEKKQKYLQTFTANQFHSISYLKENNKWEIQNTLTWSRLEQPTGNLTFMSTRDGNFEIYSMDAKGENLKNLSCNKATDYAFSFAKDGRLAFYSNRDGNDEIYIIDTAGKKQTNITNHPSADRVPYFSPDGKQVMFISNRDHKQGEIYIMDADGKNIKRITSNEYFEDAAGWSNDGKKIYFSRELKDLKDSSANAVGNGEIFVMDTDGTNETRLTNRPGFDGRPTLSPDGSKIAFYGKTAEGNYEIFLMDADGKNIINLTEDALEDYSPSWSPDGKWIAYTNGNSKNYDAWMIHLETRIKIRLTTQPKRDESPFWQPAK
jgi:TolB protein